MYLALLIALLATGSTGNQFTHTKCISPSPHRTIDYNGTWVCRTYDPIDISTQTETSCDQQRLSIINYLGLPTTEIRCLTCGGFPCIGSLYGRDKFIVAQVPDETFVTEQPPLQEPPHEIGEPNGPDLLQNGLFTTPGVSNGYYATKDDETYVLTPYGPLLLYPHRVVHYDHPELGTGLCLREEDNAFWCTHEVLNWNPSRTPVAMPHDSYYRHILDHDYYLHNGFQFEINLDDPASKCLAYGEGVVCINEADSNIMLITAEGNTTAALDTEQFYAGETSTCPRYFSTPTQVYCNETASTETPGVKDQGIYAALSDIFTDHGYRWRRIGETYTAIATDDWDVFHVEPEFDVKMYKSAELELVLLPTSIKGMQEGYYGQGWKLLPKGLNWTLSDEVNEYHAESLGPPEEIGPFKLLRALDTVYGGEDYAIIEDLPGPYSLVAMVDGSYNSHEIEGIDYTPKTRDTPVVDKRLRVPCMTITPSSNGTNTAERERVLTPWGEDTCAQYIRRGAVCSCYVELVADSSYTTTSTSSGLAFTSQTSNLGCVWHQGICQESLARSGTTVIHENGTNSLVTIERSKSSTPTGLRQNVKTHDDHYCPFFEFTAVQWQKGPDTRAAMILVPMAAVYLILTIPPMLKHCAIALLRRSKMLRSRIAQQSPKYKTEKGKFYKIEGFIAFYMTPLVYPLYAIHLTVLLIYNLFALLTWPLLWCCAMQLMLRMPHLATAFSNDNVHKFDVALDGAGESGEFFYYQGVVDFDIAATSGLQIQFSGHIDDHEAIKYTMWPIITTTVSCEYSHSLYGTHLETHHVNDNRADLPKCNPDVGGSNDPRCIPAEESTLRNFGLPQHILDNGQEFPSSLYGLYRNHPIKDGFTITYGVELPRLDGEILDVYTCGDASIEGHVLTSTTLEDGTSKQSNYTFSENGLTVQTDNVEFTYKPSGLEFTMKSDRVGHSSGILISEPPGYEDQGTHLKLPLRPVEPSLTFSYVGHHPSCWNGNCRQSNADKLTLTDYVRSFEDVSAREECHAEALYTEATEKTEFYVNWETGEEVSSAGSKTSTGERWNMIPLGVRFKNCKHQRLEGSLTFNVERSVSASTNQVDSKNCKITSATGQKYIEGGATFHIRCSEAGVLTCKSGTNDLTSTVQTHANADVVAVGSVGNPSLPYLYCPSSLQIPLDSLTNPPDYSPVDPNSPSAVTNDHKLDSEGWKHALIIALVVVCGVVGLIIFLWLISWLITLLKMLRAPKRIKESPLRRR